MPLGARPSCRLQATGKQLPAYWITQALVSVAALFSFIAVVVFSVVVKDKFEHESSAGGISQKVHLDVAGPLVIAYINVAVLVVGALRPVIDKFICKTAPASSAA